MKKLLIIAAILLVLWWIFRKKEKNTAEVPGTGTGGNIQTTRPPDSVDYVIGPYDKPYYNGTPVKPGVTGPAILGPPILEIKDPSLDPSVISSQSLTSKPGGTTEISPLLPYSSITIRR